MQISLEVLSDLSNQVLEGQLRDQQLGGLIGVQDEVCSVPESQRVSFTNSFTIATKFWQPLTEVLGYTVCDACMHALGCMPLSHGT